MPVLVTTAIGPPGPSSGPGGGGAEVWNDHDAGAMVLPDPSRAPLTSTVYDVDQSRPALGVRVAVRVPTS